MYRHRRTYLAGPALADALVQAARHDVKHLIREIEGFKA